MERLAIEIGVIIIVYVLGYWMGYKACFDYLKEEVQKKLKGDIK